MNIPRKRNMTRADNENEEDAYSDHDNDKHTQTYIYEQPHTDTRKRNGMHIKRNIPSTRTIHMKRTCEEKYNENGKHTPMKRNRNTPRTRTRHIHIKRYTENEEAHDTNPKNDKQNGKPTDKEKETWKR